VIPGQHLAWSFIPNRGEIFSNLLPQSREVFLAKALIMDEDAETLRDYLSYPWCKGDLYYVERLVYTIRALGFPSPTDIATPAMTSTPASVSTSTPMPVPALAPTLTPLPTLGSEDSGLPGGLYAKSSNLIRLVLVLSPVLLIVLALFVIRLVRWVWRR
jgi:hypothetical protein